MQKKTETEMERERIIKITRTLTTLKYRLLADAELNDTLPDRLAEYDTALAQGELKQDSSLDLLTRSLNAGNQKKA